MATNGSYHDRTAQVLYGSETGSSQEIAEEIGRVLERLRFITSVSELDAVIPESLPKQTLSVFAISTTGQGDFPSNGRHFWTSLLRKKLRADYLDGLQFAIIGLGDSSYPKFNWAARKFQKRLKQLGAEELLESCEADEQGQEGNEGAFLTWMRMLLPKILEAFPLPTGVEPIPDTENLPRKWRLKLLRTKVPDRWPNGTNFLVDERDFYTPDFSEGLPDTDCRPIPGSFWANLESNRRLTPENHWQDVRHFTLVTPQNLQYFPGDALAITPKNVSEDVSTLIALMRWESVASKLLSLAPTNPAADFTSYPKSPVPDPLPGGLLTLETLLTNHLDITAIPRRSFFATIAQYTKDPAQHDRLLEFSDPQFLDEYYDYATRPRRSILEILQEFHTVRIPWKEAINVFPVIRSRQFSIASGGNLKRTNDQKGTRFELLVAIVRYRTVIKKIRQGVCTRYLAALPEASTLNVVLKNEGRFQKKTEGQGSHILIGAGTGLAPLRALIYEKEHRLQADDQVGPTCLFFGCRNQGADDFFADTWREFQQDLRVFAAFSRDQRQKVYVQDILKQQAELVFDMIVNKHAVVVVCGSSGAMPKAVREALLDILARDQNEKDGGSVEMNREEAQAYLARMEKVGRFKQETW